MQTYFGYFDFAWLHICWWNTNNNISFHYRLIPRKTNITKFIKKSQKPYFGPILSPFAQIGAKNEFSWKKGLYQFFNIRITYHCAKNHENLMSNSWESYWRDKPKTSLFRNLFVRYSQFQSPAIDWKILQSDLPRAFWAISQKPESSQIWNMFKHARITVIQTIIIDHTDKK